MRTVLSLLLVLAAAPSFASPRDPFRSPFHDGPVSVKATVLETFDVDDLVLEGLVTGVAEPRAVVRTPAGEAVVVRTGTPIGLRGGRVVRIAKGELVVAETTSIDGTVVIRERTLEVAP